MSVVLGAGRVALLCLIMLTITRRRLPSAFTLDVFFISAHFIYAIFIGYGVHRLVEYVRVLLNRGLAGLDN